MSLSNEDIQRHIARVELHLFQGTRTIACALTTQAGFTVVGLAHCLEPADFNLQIGANEARLDAERKLAEALGAAIALTRPESLPLLLKGAPNGH